MLSLRMCACAPFPRITHEHCARQPNLRPPRATRRRPTPSTRTVSRATIGAADRGFSLVPIPNPTCQRPMRVFWSSHPSSVPSQLPPVPSTRCGRAQLPVQTQGEFVIGLSCSILKVFYQASKLNPPRPDWKRPAAYWSRRLRSKMPQGYATPRKKRAQ